MLKSVAKHNVGGTRLFTFPPASKMRLLPILDYSQLKMAAVVGGAPASYVRAGDCQHVHNRNTSMEVYIFFLGWGGGR